MARDPLELIRTDLRQLPAYTPGEQVRDCIKLNTNESAVPPSPAVQAALRQLSLEDDRLRLYPQPLADDLRQAATQRYGVDADRILAGNGSDDCLTILFRSHCQAGDRYACPWPTYSLYDTLAGIQGVEPVHLPWRDWQHDDWGLPIGLTESGAKLVFVANPNNPSATRVPTQALRHLADQLDGLLVVDEAYVDFALGEDADASMLPYLEAHPNLVVLRTFSKSASLAGARLGLLFAHPALIERYQAVKDSYNVNAISQALGIAALQDVDHQRQLVATTLKERRRLEEGLARHGWTWPPSAANFLLCSVGPTARDIYRGLKERGILVRFFDRPGLDTRLRITVGAAAENQALLTVLDELL